MGAMRYVKLMMIYIKGTNNLYISHSIDCLVIGYQNDL